MDVRTVEALVRDEAEDGAWAVAAVAVDPVATVFVPIVEQPHRTSRASPAWT